MSIRGIKMVHDKGDHYIVEREGEQPLRVAKGRLAYKTVQAIEHFRKMNCGGAVSYAGGGIVKEPFQLPDEPIIPETYGGMTTIDPARAVPAGFPPIPPPKTKGLTPISNLPENLANQLSTLKAPSVPGGPENDARPLIAHIPPAETTTKETASPPPKAESPTSAYIPNAAGEISSGVQRQLFGERAIADVAGDVGQKDAAILAQQQSGMETERQKYELDKASNLKHQADLQQWLLSDEGKVKSDRWWNSRTTPQKISAAFAMILGGIGAGLSRGPNYALQMIDKAVDRDIESQKMNIEVKDSLLKTYMQQGHNIDSAHLLTKADIADKVAVDMKRVAAMSAGPAAAAQVEQISGAIQQHAAELRLQAATNTFSLRHAAVMAPMQEQQARMSLEMAKIHQQAMAHLMGSMSGEGGLDARILEMPGFEKYLDRKVTLPDGKIAFGKDKEDATKAQEHIDTFHVLATKLSRLQNLLRSGHPATIDRGVAEAYRNDLLAEMGHAHDLRRLSDIDLQMFGKQVPDLEALFKPFAQQKLDALGKSFGDRLSPVYERLLNRKVKRPNE